MRINPGSGPYAVMPHPTDGTVWYTSGVFGGTPGFLRFDPKPSSDSIRAEGGHRHARRRYRQERRAVGLGSDGHLSSFDRRKCKGPLNGPNATGNHCPEGFALHKYPGPGFEGFDENSAESSYYTWVDHHNTVGLGENVPISTANLQDGFVGSRTAR